MSSKIDGFSPDLGLEYISRGGDAAASLPAQADTSLTGSQVRNWLGELFGEQSPDQLMRAFAAPQIAETRLLHPALFERLVHESAATLRHMAAEDEDDSLLAASQLLDEELALRELLENYRYLLVKA